jgi:hypothetical protein
VDHRGLDVDRRRGFAVAAVVQALDAVSIRAFQPLTAPQILLVGQGAPAELMRGLICAA